MKKVLATAAVLALAGAANAQWSEVGDAGDFPTGGAQAVVGAGALSTISGATDAAGGDAHDAYIIDIKDPASFYATTDVNQDPNASASWDTRLWIFDLAGNALLFNDDSPTESNFESLITAMSNDGTGVSLAAGQYVLVISGFSEEAQDGLGASIFSGGFTDVQGPDGPGDQAANGFQWEFNAGGPNPASGAYTIALSGASFVPAPGAAALLGLGGLVAARRRRA